MAKNANLSEEQRAEAEQVFAEFVEEYNATHEDTQAYVTPMPGNNFQLTIAKWPPAEPYFAIEPDLEPGER